MNLKKFALFAGLLVSAVSMAAQMQVVDTLEEALIAAREKQGIVMMNFTGTDWCTACKHLKEKVFTSEAYCNAYGDKIVMTAVDFPRLPELRAKISKEEAQRREKLLMSYQINGLPSVVLMDAGGFPFAIINGTRPEPEAYVELITTALKAKETRDAAFEKAQNLTGMERATALAEALNAVPRACRDKYPLIVKEINLLDPNNTLGYREVLGKSEKYVQQLEALRTLANSFVGHFEPDLIRADIQKIITFLENKDLDPEIRQFACRTLGDSYALLFSVSRKEPKETRDELLAQMLKAYEDAIAALPDSALAKKLQATVDINKQRMAEEKEAKK